MSLIQKLSEAEEGSRELDAEIVTTIVLPHSPCHRHVDGTWYVNVRHPGEAAVAILKSKDPTYEVGDDWRIPGPYDIARNAPRYTTSLDAALALVEQKLPGCNWRIQRQRDKCYTIISRKAPEFYDIWVEQHGATPALSVLGALLRAIEASPTPSRKEAGNT